MVNIFIRLILLDIIQSFTFKFLPAVKMLMIATIIQHVYEHYKNVMFSDDYELQNKKT